jgi:DNA modification methylase
MSRIEDSVVCMDAADFLDRFEDNSVDLFLSDLPFGIDYFDRPASDREAGGGVSKFDDSLATAASLVRKILEKMTAKVKPEGWICLMISEDLRWALNNEITIINTQKKIEGKKLAMPTQPWIWYRPNSRNNPIHGHLHAKSMYDIMIPINPGKAVLRKPCENVVVIDSFYGDRVHAHQKPIELGEELISRFTLPGDLVVDVTMGSGAFVAAAAKTGRKFAGCDLNPDIVPLAQGLVAQYFGNTKVADSTPTKGLYTMGTPLSPDDDFFGTGPIALAGDFDDSEEFEKDELVADGDAWSDDEYEEDEEEIEDDYVDEDDDEVNLDLDFVPDEEDEDA